MPVVGFLHNGTPDQSAHLMAAFRKGLSETGYVEGRSVAIEFRFAHNEYDRLPALAADLVRGRVAVIATGTTNATLAAKAATTTIPMPSIRSKRVSSLASTGRAETSLGSIP
jgi:ABC-type uncharacterized transport system substrate-binding protein